MRTLHRVTDYKIPHIAKNIATIGLSFIVTTLMSGCSQDKKVEHTLKCMLESVVDAKKDKAVEFKKEDVINNDFIYYFTVYDDGTVGVHSEDITYGEDVYIKDQAGQSNYSLKRENGVDTNMKFVFTKEFDDVRFLIVDKNITYNYNCAED